MERKKNKLKTINYCFETFESKKAKEKNKRQKFKDEKALRKNSIRSKGIKLHFSRTISLKFFRYNWEQEMSIFRKKRNERERERE